MVDFNFDVKPILVQKCYLCHGPDPGTRKAGLRLDTFEGATAALKEGGKAIVPGHVNDSELVGRIYHNDPEQIHDQYGRQVDAVVDSGPGTFFPSTLVDLTGSEPEILREGRGVLS